MSNPKIPFERMPPRRRRPLTSGSRILIGLGVIAATIAVIALFKGIW